MRFEEYVAARRTRLVEHAVDLGVEEDDAAALVDATLERYRRQVERAEDPDPLVHDALARAAAPPRSGPRVPRQVAWLAGALAVAVVVGVLGVVAWRQRPEPAQVAVPTLFGLDATTASGMLREAGFDVGLETVPVCEPRGLVLGSTPAGGSEADEGSTVELRSAISPDDDCLGLVDRAAAWQFVAFARGGPAPAFADTVTLVVDGSEPYQLGRAGDRGRWGGLLDALAAVYAAPARSGTSTPQLVVRTGVPPARHCGVARPPASGERESLRLQVQPDPQHVLPCPLTVDLFRSDDGTVDGVIDAVVVYTADYDAISKWS